YARVWRAPPPIETDVQKDRMLIGIGLILLAVLGGVVAFRRILNPSQPGDPSKLLTIIAALILMAIVGAALIGASRSRSAHSALAAGCTSVLAVFGVMTMMFLAFVFFVLYQC